MKFYNTLSKKVEEFVFNDDVVKMYTCGPTVYHYAHIGNLRTYIFEDILEKGLVFAGYKVKRVMNITDVGHMVNDGEVGNDKMMEGARREHKTPQEIADFYTEAFFNDCAKLNIKKPEIVEKATSHIEDYIKVISTLLLKGFAYSSSGNIYFDVSKAKDYYKLSGNLELIVGARDDVEEDLNKRNPHDFGLWFTKSKFDAQDQKWDSPWGVGYPGWHIECSTLAYIYLGEYLDIHCGGVDNIFPHHTNEIAQSEAFLGHKWCNYFMHGAHLNTNSGKMSKSSGEFLTVDLLESKGFNPLSYRYFCLGSHYRNQLVFSYDSLEQAENAYNKLKSRVLSLEEDGDISFEKVSLYKDKFIKEIGSDLNTSNMLSLVYEVLKDVSLNSSTKREIIRLYDEVLSLDLLKVQDKKNVINEEFVLKKIEERNSFKKEKNYEEADRIRNELLELGIKLIDTKDGTKYEW